MDSFSEQPVELAVLHGPKLEQLVVAAVEPGSPVHVELAVVLAASLAVLAVKSERLAVLVDQLVDWLDSTAEPSFVDSVAVAAFDSANSAVEQPVELAELGHF